jgi:hypothetical protein
VGTRRPVAEREETYLLHSRSKRPAAAFDSPHGQAANEDGEPTYEALTLLLSLDIEDQDCS